MERGRQVYAHQKCATCHQIAKKGNSRFPLDGVASRLSAEDLRRWITAAKRSRINAFVLLSHGQDTAATMTMNELVPQPEAHTGQEATAIRAPKEAANAKIQDLFSKVVDESISDSELDTIAKQVLG